MKLSLFSTYSTNGGDCDLTVMVFTRGRELLKRVWEGRSVCLTVSQIVKQFCVTNTRQSSHIRLFLG